MKKIEVQLVKGALHELSSTTSIFITIDPQFADLAQVVEEEVKFLVGHKKVVCLPLPPDALKFYEVKHPMIMVTDKQFSALEPHNG